MPGIKVTFFQRKPFDNHFSLEKVFAIVRQNLYPSYQSQIFQSKYKSKGIIKRLYNILEASIRQKEINHLEGDTTYLALGLKGEKTILTIADLAPLNRSINKLKQKLLIFFWGYLPAKKCRYIVVFSPFIKTEIIKYLKIKPKKIKIIPCPLDLDFKFTPKKFESKKPTILQVGAAYNKNLEKVDQAIRNINCRLQIIGQLSKEQKKLLNRLKIDYQASHNLIKKEVIRKYEKADLVIFASTYEGFGLPIIEAQTVGRPLITSNLEPMKWVAGKGAIYVDPQKVSSIKKAILTIMQDKKLRGKIIKAGQLNIKRFDPKKITQKYAKLYQELYEQNH